MHTPEAVATMRRTLDRIGLAESALDGVLGDADARLSPAEQEALWWWRARGREPLAVAARLFLLQQPVTATEARRALEADGLRAAATLGLVEETRAKVVPRVQLSVHGTVVIASDAPVARRDLVLGPTQATLVLERLLLRRPVRRALDLGTGTGYLALRLGERCAEVLGTEVSPRALRYARLNAALAGLGNVTFARSDRFAALGRQRFDLIVGNLPFVISPDRRWGYRDAGQPTDGFLASVVRASGRHLVEGGFAQLLGQWIHRAGEPEDRRLAPWVVASGCDALVLRIETEPADVYAARWSPGPVPIEARERQRRLRAWMAAYEAQGITAITTGLITLRRRSAPRHYLMIEDAPAAFDGDAIQRRFALADAGEARKARRRRPDAG